MRFTVVLFFIALLPVMMLVHWWDFEERQQPKLRDHVERILKKARIRGATVDLRYLDLSITGDAPDENAITTARQAIHEIGAARLVNDRLSILARLKATLHGDQQRLTLEGWMPDAKITEGLREFLQTIRPDLQISVESVQVSSLVRLPEGEKLPLRADSAMLQPIVSAMHVPSALDITRKDGRLTVTGMVPSEALRKSILEAIRSGPHGLPVEAEKLRATTFALAAPFTSEEVIAPFLRSFYGTLAPGDFSVHADENPRLSADATRTLESAWLTHLRPMTKGRRAEMDLTYFPSRFHFPGRRIETALPEDSLQTVRDALTGQFFVFSPGSAALHAEEQARLASLVPALLSAGPALKLIVGGHPDPAGDLKTETALARRRAEQVVSFLIEQGTPATEIQAIAFDPVPLGTKHAPTQIRSVEILIQ
ncbi:MAG: OmpA family protein [Verrucomicrobiota bacterium]